MEIIDFIDKKTLNLINFVGSSFCFDTESFLRNINATNLDTPRMKFVPQDNSSNLRDGLFWDNKPTVMPLPMVIYENQRPLPN